MYHSELLLLWKTEIIDEHAFIHTRYDIADRSVYRSDFEIERQLQRNQTKVRRLIIDTKFRNKTILMESVHFGLIEGAVTVIELTTILQTKARTKAKVILEIVIVSIVEVGVKRNISTIKTGINCD